MDAYLAMLLVMLFKTALYAIPVLAVASFAWLNLALFRIFFPVKRRRYSRRAPSLKG